MADPPRALDGACSMSSPLHAAHQHAANADDFLSEGLLIPAAEEHAKAADAFLQCEQKSSDGNTKRTLRMLYNEHVRAQKELERRIAKLREENKDPTRPHKVSFTRAERSTSPHPRTVPSPPPPPSVRLMDSQNNVDESFMVLGQRSDPGDAFNNFWRIMEGMLDNLSQPVAFTTAPLGTESGVSAKRSVQRDGSSGSETDREAPFASRFSRKLGLDSRHKSSMLAPSNPTHAIDTGQDLLDETDEEVLVDEADQLSESFCLVPLESESATSALKRENVSLRQEVEETQRRLAEAERVLQLRKEQDQLLRDSIVMARHQAQRAMGASLVLQRPSGQQPAVDLGALNINIPSVPTAVAAINGGRDREAQLLRRIRDLEEEVRLARVENDKQKVMIARFRERWEKLKDAAKRKKDAKAAAETVKVGVRERIEEEPEAEQELDEASHA